MRTHIAWILTMGLGASVAGQASAQGTNPPTPKRPTGSSTTTPPVATKAAAPADLAAKRAKLDADEKLAREEMNRVLQEWEKRSKQIKSLDVVFDRVDKSVGWGDQYYQGRAMLQSPDLACLQFQKYKLDAKGKPLVVAAKDGKPTQQLDPEPFERIVCTGSEVLQYSWEDRKIFVFPLDEESRQKALQQGPLPFLFNMKAAEARQRYSMTLIDQDVRDYLISIVPNEQIDKKSFTRAFLWLSKSTFLPNQLRLYTVGEKEYQEFRFAGGNNTIEANRPLDPKFFLPTKYPKWTVINNPGAGGGAAPADAAPPVGQPARRAANQPEAKPAARPR